MHVLPLLAFVPQNLKLYDDCCYIIYSIVEYDNEDDVAPVHSSVIRNVQLNNVPIIAIAQYASDQFAFGNKHIRTAGVSIILYI